MTTALALRPPPPPKDTRADEPDDFGKSKKDVRLSEKALELRRRVEKRRQHRAAVRVSRGAPRQSTTPTCV